VSRVPPHASPGSDPPGADELEQLEELGDDAIIAQQQGAHVPKPRAQVTEDARSIVISDHPSAGSNPPSAPKIPADRAVKKRSERTEKTVVIRDRRQIDELRREMAKRQPKPTQKPKPALASNQGLLLWAVVGVAAFLIGGLVALLATRHDSASDTSDAPAKPAVSEVTVPSAAPVTTAEPPSVSIDELPIEGSKKQK
jgi:hypothetical protein